MQTSRLLMLLSLVPFGMATALPSRGQALVNDVPVLWEPVVTPTPGQPRQPQARQPQASPPSAPAEAIVWELIPDDNAATGQHHNPATPHSPVVWEVIPGSVKPLGPTPSEAFAQDQDDSNDPATPPVDAVVFEQSQPARTSPVPPPPPALQALNRSIAFADGTVGPDISLRIPNGFRWSERWFGDISVLGYSYQNGRRSGDPFVPAQDSGNLDGWGILHANVLQTNHWSVTLNTSFRSLQNNPDLPGGSTGIDDGLSSGFRIARAIGDTGGIAFGGEQVIQWDDQTDTGRNLYLMASKGWWLGKGGNDYPLLIANGGVGTGRFASLTQNDPRGEALGAPFDFTCVAVESNRTQATIDENLCWGPIGSVSLVVNPWWGTFVDYAISRATLGVSANLTAGIPLRATAGVHFVENNEVVSFDRLRWIAQFSIGF